MSRWLALLLLPLAAQAQRYYVYVGDLGPDYVLFAWGAPRDGGNSIGRDSKLVGKAEVRIDNRTLATDHNWLVVRNLKPDTEYEYEVDLDGKRIGGDRLRTHAAQASKFCFFMIGDWGSGDSLQYRVAEAMAREFERRRNTDCPVRFVLSNGDNIYGHLGLLGFKGTGNEDRDWEQKFFRPYAPILAHVPFHPVLGNHDGNETEHQGDTAVYLDNFFFPGNEPARYYRFSYGGLADFFALDSTRNNQNGPPAPFFGPESRQSTWLTQALRESRAPWKIPYMHHPMFNAGPRHPSSITELKHWADAFAQAGVKVVFAGHEHNFQYTEVRPETYNIQFIVSGAGGELRASDVRSTMRQSFTAGFAPQAHFCVVEIDGKTMRVTPLSYTAMRVIGPNGEQKQMPIVINLP